MVKKLRLLLCSRGMFALGGDQFMFDVVHIYWNLLWKMVYLKSHLCYEKPRKVWSICKIDSLKKSIIIIIKYSISKESI